MFIGRTDAEAETPIPPHVKSWLIRKDPDAGRDWGQEEKGTTEDEIAGWHHRLDGHEFEWTLGVGFGQGGLKCCDSWGRKESDMTAQLNWDELALCSRWPKYWSFSFSISPSNEYSEFISFRIDCFDLFAIQGILKSLLQHQSPNTIFIHTENSKESTNNY